MTPTPITQPPTAATALRVHSVDAEEGLIWALTDGRDRLVGSAAASVWEPISAADTTTAEIEVWVAPGDGAELRWARLLGEVMAGLRLVEVERVVARSSSNDADRLRRLLGAGFRVSGVDRHGTLQLTHG
jgi:hypothetical protein